MTTAAPTPFSSYVIGGTHGQAESWLRQFSSPAKVKILNSPRDLIGMPKKANVFLIGTYKDRADWIEIRHQLEYHEAVVLQDK